MIKSLLKMRFLVSLGMTKTYSCHCEAKPKQSLFGTLMRAMKKGWIFTFALFVILTLPQVAFSKNSVKLYLFYSEETGGLKIEEEIIKPLSKKYPVEVQTFSVNQLKNYDLMIKFEKELKVAEKDLPAVIIGDKILGGEAEIRRDLEGWVKLYAQQGGTSWPSLKEAVGQEEGWIPVPPQKRRKNQERLFMLRFSTCRVVSTAKR